jgi:hypothetical protein
VATLPGAVLLLVGRLRPRRRGTRLEDRVPARVAAAVSADPGRTARGGADRPGTRFDRGARACTAQSWGGD